ncbi:MAG: S8 family serine peptidase [Rubrivivax sp.]
MGRLRECLLVLGLALAAAAAGAEPVAKVIVAFKPEVAGARWRALSTQRADAVTAEGGRRAAALSAHAGVTLEAGRLFGPRSMVVRAKGVDAASLARRLAAHPDVAYAVVDRRWRAFAAPNDPLYAAGPASGRGPAVGQWYLHAPDDNLRSSVNAQDAWDWVTGSRSLVVAVLDTGIRSEHPDLSGRVVSGYDMVSDADYANDGDARDSDASDPGSWVTSTEDGNTRGPFYGCGAEDSSWHGTQVSGIIGAAANDGVGMAGTAHGVRLQPVRVLGKCGGDASDILAGIYWAAGVDQPGLPGNRTPARVLNLSLGGESDCSAADLEAVRTITAAPYNAVIVAAAGNSTGHAVGTPANCPGVIAVTGLRHSGAKVGFSDLGPEVAIAAPGGNCVNIEAGSPCLYPILTSSNSGTRGPVAGGSIWTDSFEISVGTSFATPIVAGAAALLLSARPEWTTVEVRETLQRTARPFPTSGSDNGPSDPTPVPMCRAPDGTDQLQCYCSVGLCGAGMLDIGAAVLEAVQRVPLAEAASQLLDHAERTYPQYFPGPAANQSWGPFDYRYYPATGRYVGVAIRSDARYRLNGVYVMGGDFGSGPLFVGPLTDFIVPVAGR